MYYNISTVGGVPLNSELTIYNIILINILAKYKHTIDSRVHPLNNNIRSAG